MGVRIKIKIKIKAIMTQFQPYRTMSRKLCLCYKYFGLFQCSDRGPRGQRFLIYTPLDWMEQTLGEERAAM